MQKTEANMTAPSGKTQKIPIFALPDAEVGIFVWYNFPFCFQTHKHIFLPVQKLGLGASISVSCLSQTQAG